MQGNTQPNSMLGTPVDLAAAQDPTHPQFHFSLGQFVTLLLLGLQAYGEAKAHGAAVALDPQHVVSYTQGVLSVLHPDVPVGE